MNNILVQNKNPMSKLVVAWDLDGTLFDSQHRVKIEDGKFDLDYWIANCTEEQIHKDKLLPLTDLFKEYSKTGFTQICVTARVINEHDLSFFKKHGFEFDMILHRSTSSELDQILKSRKLNEYFSQNEMIPFMAFDDKQENLEVFDKFGFRTFHAEYMNEKLETGSYQEMKKRPAEFVN